MIVYIFEHVPMEGGHLKLGLNDSTVQARAMGGRIAGWKRLGIDGVDLDIEQGIGDDRAAGANLLALIAGTPPCE
jgi:hypothetical protein